MSGPDKQLIERKLRELADYTTKLEEFRGMDKEAFLDDYHHFGLAEHYLQLAIETVLDVSRHLVVSLELQTPEDSYGLFAVLAQSHIVPTNFATDNQAMIGVRNRLVHGYTEIDHIKIYNYLQEHFSVFEQFIKHISTYLTA